MLKIWHCNCSQNREQKLFLRLYLFSEQLDLGANRPKKEKIMYKKFISSRVQVVIALLALLLLTVGIYMTAFSGRPNVVSAGTSGVQQTPTPRTKQTPEPDMTATPCPSPDPSNANAEPCPSPSPMPTTSPSP